MLHCHLTLNFVAFFLSILISGLSFSFFSFSEISAISAGGPNFFHTSTRPRSRPCTRLCCPRRRPTLPDALVPDECEALGGAGAALLDVLLGVSVRLHDGRLATAATLLFSSVSLVFCSISLYGAPAATCARSRTDHNILVFL